MTGIIFLTVSESVKYSVCPSLLHSKSNHTVLNNIKSAIPYPGCKGSVVFWGFITLNGVGTLEPVDGTINSLKYIDVLDSQRWPVITTNIAQNPWTFQDDNAPWHTSRFKTHWKQVTWPSQSPDYNSIENVWRTLKCRLHSKTGARSCNQRHSHQDRARLIRDHQFWLRPTIRASTTHYQLAYFRFWGLVAV